MIVGVALTCSRCACSGSEEALWEERGERLVQEALWPGGHPTGGAHERNGRQKLHPATGLVKL